MNAKKILFGFLTIGILFGASCTTDSDGSIYESSIDRKKVTKGTDAIDRKKVTKGTDAIDRKKVTKGTDASFIDRKKVTKGTDAKS